MAGMAVAWLGRNHWESSHWLGCSLVFGTILTVLLSCPAGRKHSEILLLLGLLCLGSSSATLLSLQYERLQAPFPPGAPLRTATLERINRSTPEAMQADLLLQPTADCPRERRIRARLEGPGSLRLSPGDRIVFKARISPPQPHGNPHDFDYTTYLYVHGISGTAYVPESHWKSLPTDTPLPWRSRLLRLRQTLNERYARWLDREVCGLVSAMTLGDKTRLQDETRLLFADTGTSHVLALSGLHLGILYTLLHALFLRWFSRRLFFIAAHVLTLVGLWFFVFLTGAPLSLQRAALMFSLWTVSLCLQRTSHSGLNHWALAALILLCCSPLSLLDVSFQLSFAAVLAILWCNERMWAYNRKQEDGEPFDTTGWYIAPQAPRPTLAERWHKELHTPIRPKLKHWLRWSVLPFFCLSLSAQLGTLPFVLYYFHQFTPYTLLANILVIPAAYLLIGGALLLSVLPFQPILSAVGAGMNGVTRLLTGGLEWMSTWPGATLKCYPSALTLLLGTVGAVLLWQLCHTHLKRRRLHLIYALTGCLAATGMSLVLTWKQRQLPPQVIIYNVPRARMVHFIASNSESYLYSSLPADSTTEKMAYIRRQFWEPYGMTAPRLLTASCSRNGTLTRRNGLFLFGRQRVCLLTHSPRPANRAVPVGVHTLLICRGCKASLTEVCQVFRPQHVVLDRSLSARLRQRWKKECRQAGIVCHDLRDDGAYIGRL